MSLKARGISRRTFNLAISASLIGQILPFKSFSLSNEHVSKDGLLHLTDEGKLNIYSGVGHTSIYSKENPLFLIKKKLNISEDQCRFMFGSNPEQLPALLSQHINHLSFTSKATNEKAIDVLKTSISEIGKDADQILLKNRILILDDQISLKTKKMVNQIKGNGIIVAVKEVV